MKATFRRFAHQSATTVGSPIGFFAAVAVVILWLCAGPLFNFSDTWQLAINTGTTIVTFLMVFLIQNSQNRDARAIHLKLDELLHAVKGARNSFINVESLPDERLLDLQKEFEQLQSEYNIEVISTKHIKARKRSSTQEKVCSSPLQNKSPD